MGYSTAPEHLTDLRIALDEAADDVERVATRIGGWHDRHWKTPYLTEVLGLVSNLDEQATALRELAERIDP